MYVSVQISPVAFNCRFSVIVCDKLSAINWTGPVEVLRGFYMLSTEFTNAKCLRRVSVAVSKCTNFVMEAICVKQSDRPSSWLF